ncbi:MAG: phage tail protein [Verrucomicrobiales bacterium]|nr:phage tail protein [Verrucomicrobiales bacterium]
MATGDRRDPYVGFRFLLEIEGLISGGFSEVTGLQVEVEMEDYVEGGHNGHPHKLVKGRRYPNLVLKRGLADADTLWKWHQGVGKPKAKIERRTVRIVVLDHEGREKFGWRFLQAHPVKWTAADFKGDGNSVAFETLELVHCGIQRG